VRLDSQNELKQNDQEIPNNCVEHYLIQQESTNKEDTTTDNPTKLRLESSEHVFDNVLSLVYHYSTTK
jgi:hypothetical protein